MPMIGVQGIRGGVGTTSLAAGLGWALSKLGDRVMMVDACRDNQLCLHFNQKLYEQQGSMFAYLKQKAWYETAFHFSECLDFLPYGNTAANSNVVQNYVPFFFCKKNFGERTYSAQISGADPEGTETKQNSQKRKRR